MGSWSVYCGISNIAITAGDDCVLLPIKKEEYGYGNSYLTHYVSALPIFGTYDDYGGITDIVKDKNTELIEKYFKVTIEEFTKHFTNIRENNNELLSTELGNSYMWINREVYDFMVSYIDDNEKGHFKFGNKDLLTYFGFEYLGIDNEHTYCQQPTRYNQLWKYEDKVFCSDGTWLHYGKESIYNFDGEYSSLNSIIELNEKMISIKDKSWIQLYDIVFTKTLQNRLLNLINVSEHDLFSMELAEYYKEDFPEKYQSLMEAANLKMKGFKFEYYRNLNYFKKELSDLVILRHNLHCMSGDLKPFTSYLTPQCGEREHHQVLLEKFVEINKSKIEY